MMEIGYGDVINVTSKHLRNSSKWWWRVKASTEDILYATFSTSHPSYELRERAVIYASACTSKAVAVSNNGDITEIPWVDPLGPPFKASERIPIVRRDELVTHQKIKQGVDVVQYNGTSYIHKYMTVSSDFQSFEFEIGNYEKTVGSPYLAKLLYIVTDKGVNRGFLIEYITSESLEKIHLTSSEKYLVISLILDALSDLESRRYYPQDLKLPNILLSGDKCSLHLIDLGPGLTEGMYRPESERIILRGKIESGDMLYTFGKTVWDLYDDELPDILGEPVKGSVPPLIEMIVTECCGKQLEPGLRIVDICKKYSGALKEAARTNNEWITEFH